MSRRRHLHHRTNRAGAGLLDSAALPAGGAVVRCTPVRVSVVCGYQAVCVNRSTGVWSLFYCSAAKETTAEDAAMTLLFHFESDWRGASEFPHSAPMYT